MIRPIVKDTFFLSQKAVPATKNDISIGQDLLDTLMANSHRCVGMAANMIGVNKAIIIVNMGFNNIVMFNPRVLNCSGEYETEDDITRQIVDVIEEMDDNEKKLCLDLVNQVHSYHCRIQKRDIHNA